MPLIRSANFNLFVEIVVRIILVSAFWLSQPALHVEYTACGVFGHGSYDVISHKKSPTRRGLRTRRCPDLHHSRFHRSDRTSRTYMETMQPFTRVLHKQTMELENMYPRHDSYVPASALWTIVLSVPCVLSLIAWAGCSDCNDALEILLAWSLSLGINGVLTDTVKLIAGRPRPDFYYRCFPDGVETPDFKCTGDPAEIMDGRKSFPSGHSSLSFCSLGVASAWLCGRLGVLSRRRGSGIRVMTCLAPLMMAACVALSRTCDYHHHWQDILAGSLLGYTVAIFCYRQYYNPLSSELAGIPYIVSSVNSAKFFNGKPDSPVKDLKEETPLLNGKKDDKWI